MKIFAIADLHLSLNENINKSMEVFGEGWENYVERLKVSWLKAIKEEDIVLLPGDLSWGLKLDEAIDDLEWISKLPGTKIMVKGNHDLWWSGIKKLNELYDNMIFLQNDCYYIKEKDLAICGTRGWNLPATEEFTEQDLKIYNREKMRLKFSLDRAKALNAGHIITAMHYPPADSERKLIGFTEILEEYDVEACVYGHLHGMISYGKGIKGNYHGIEYRLVSLDYLGAVPKLIYDEELCL